MNQMVCPSVARGILLDQQQDGIVLGLPGTDYRLHLRVQQPLQVDLHHRISGVIRTRARRVDLVGTGGRYIEPVEGRPRRLQGTITAVDPAANTITVRCSGCPFVCLLMAGQKAAGFSTGALVGFDVERGAMFDPI